MERIKPDPYLTSCTIINLKYIIYLNVNAKTIKPLKGKRRRISLQHKGGRDFLGYKTKRTKHKRKIDKLVS